ncbi:MAG: 4-hydroxythreonine-4-phosphate dehydrogenase PdxA, partial [Myxococcota bacterium]
EETQMVVFGDVEVLRRAAREAAPGVTVVEVSSASAAFQEHRSRELPVVPVSSIDDAAFDWGHPVDASDRAQVQYIRGAFDAVSNGDADALVTAPVNKVSMRRAGVDFPGHTEMLAELSRAGPPVMMLAGPTLKVVPLTTHVPLAEVAALIDEEKVGHGIRVTHDAFRRYFGPSSPRIAVAGLNPHAGDGGLFGDEEDRVIRPAIEKARAQGIEVDGPLPGDSVFHRAKTGEYDVVIGMYHDQALIPLKLLDFDHAVNVTLGLPIIRTSVDHGTAYDIAGRGVAAASSMIAALRLAGRMVRSSDVPAAPPA